VPHSSVRSHHLATRRIDRSFSPRKAVANTLPFVAITENYGLGGNRIGMGFFTRFPEFRNCGNRLLNSGRKKREKGPEKGPGSNGANLRADFIRISNL